MAGMAARCDRGGAVDCGPAVAGCTRLGQSRLQEELLRSGTVEAVACNPPVPGLVRVEHANSSATVCLGDLICTCKYSGEGCIWSWQAGSHACMPHSADGVSTAFRGC